MAIDPTTITREDMRAIIKHNKVNAKRRRPDDPLYKLSALRCRNHLCQQRHLRRNRCVVTEDYSVMTRQYKCYSCGHTFNTIEKLLVKISPIIIVSSDGKGSAFEFSRFYESIKSCCDTLFSSDRAMRIAEGIHEMMQNQNKNGGLRIPATWLVERVLESLLENSWLAHTRYVANHKKFASQEQFIRYISKPKQ